MTAYKRHSFVNQEVYDSHQVIEGCHTRELGPTHVVSSPYKLGSCRLRSTTQEYMLGGICDHMELKRGSAEYFVFSAKYYHLSQSLSK